MRFGLTDEQKLLQATVRDFAAVTFEDSRRKAAVDPDDRGRLDGWQGLHDLGLTTILVPQEFGGSGGSLTDACVVAEALGAACAPVPYVGAAIAAPSLLLACGGSGAIADLVAGATYSVVVDRDLSWPATAPALAWDWLPGAVGLVLVHGALVTVALDHPLRLEHSYDPLHPLAAVRDAVSDDATPLGEDLRRVLAFTRVGLASFCLGLASSALQEAVGYAGVREQYGQRIGSFQAVQHLCADMLVDVESSRSIVYGASWVAQESSADEAERRCAAALSWAGSAAIRVCESSIQVLGGIGVTQEHVAHHRLRTAHLFSSAFGGVRAANDVLGGHRLTSSRAKG